MYKSICVATAMEDDEDSTRDCVWNQPFLYSCIDYNVSRYDTYFIHDISNIYSVLICL